MFEDANKLTAFLKVSGKSEEGREIERGRKRGAKRGEAKEKVISNGSVKTYT